MINPQWIKHNLAAKIQSGILLVSLTALLGILGWLIGGLQLTAIAIGTVLVLYFFGPMMSPALVLKINHGRRLDAAEAPQINEILQTLARRAQLDHLPQLFYLPTDAMLAYTVGSPDNAAVAVSAGLLRRLSWRELAAVLAHEVGHIRHNDVHMMAFASLVSHLTRLLSVFGQFLLILSLPMLLVGQVLIGWAAIFLLIFAPTLSSLLQLGLSRAREYSADMTAAELTGNPEALAAALAKIDRAQKNLLSGLTWPALPRLPEATWLRTHPPTKERIRRLLNVRDSHQPAHYAYL
jgi:heat shock protein HtpX